MNALTRNELRELTEPRKGPCLSIFLPRHAGAGSAQDPIRLRNLLRRGLDSLQGQHWPDEVIDQVTRRVREYAAGGWCWQNHHESLALFSAPGFFREFSVSFDVPELAVVTAQFHLKPLFPLVEVQGRYFLLALSQGAVRVYRGDCDGLTPVNDLDLPPSPLARGDEGHDRRSRQCHAANRSGHLSMIFHGHNARHERRKQILLSHFRIVDEAVRARAAAGSEPIVLAGVGYLCALYRNVSRASCLLEEEIHGAPDHVPADELRRRSWEIASSYFQSVRDRVADEYHQLWHTSRASNNVNVIAAAARNGRVKTLFVAVGAHHWTHASQEKGNPAGSVVSQDLLNMASLDTFMAGGRVYALSPEQVPGHSLAAAVFRY